MLKTRSLLILVAFLSVVAFISGWQSTYTKDASLLGAIKALALIVSPFMLASSLILLAFSFVNISQAADGRLVLNSQSFYWRMMCWLFPNEFKGKLSVSLCKIYWMNVVFTMMCTLILFVVSGLGVAIYVLVVYGFPRIEWTPEGITITISGIACGVALILVGMFAETQHGKVAGYACGVLMAFALAVVPTYMFGINTWLYYVIYFLGGCIGIFGVVFAAVFGLRWLVLKIAPPDSAIVLTLSAMVKKFCPMLAAETIF